MNANEKWEEIIKVLTDLTSPEFMQELDNKDGLKALDDLVWETYPHPEDDWQIDNDWDEMMELAIWDERDE